LVGGLLPCHNLRKHAENKLRDVDTDCPFVELADHDLVFGHGDLHNAFAPDETYNDLLADRSSYEDSDHGVYFNGKGFGFVRLQQLATEHLLGARG
jgi:hypothetical protein